LSDNISIAIEHFSPDLLAAYEAFGLERASEGAVGIEWAFPSEGAPCAPFCVARTEGRIIGLSANIAGRIKLGGAQGTAYQAVDSFVSEEARGKRLFTRLASEFADAAEQAGVDVTWGFPNANAAPAWFGKLGWQNFGQVPFLVRPLNASYALRRLGLPGGFALARGRPVASVQPTAFSAETDDLWARFSRDIACGIVRDAAALNRRIFAAPHGHEYRVSLYGEGEDAALVISRLMHKHGSTIAYVLEAMGGRALAPLLRAEMAHFARQGAEMALAWCFPWSPNFGAYRSAGFFRLPERLRPVEINFGARALTPLGEAAMRRENWYLSYLDSDGI
jgi:GNAT superfamily N-acetyltransferase